MTYHHELSNYSTELSAFCFVGSVASGVDGASQQSHRTRKLPIMRSTDHPKAFNMIWICRLALLFLGRMGPISLLESMTYERHFPLDRLGDKRPITNYYEL